MSSAADQATAASPSAEAAGEVGAAAALQEQLLGELRRHLGDAVLESSELAGGELCVRIDRTAWLRAAEVLRHTMGMDYFCFLSGLDWMVNPDLSGEKVWDPDGGVSTEEDDAEDAGGEAGGGQEGPGAHGGYRTGVAGGATRFQVFARVHSTTRKAGLTLKADLDDDDLRVASWVSVYRGADWHERETWEMYGFVFDGHPGLRHMYLPGEFEGHPLRKDFPLLAREVKPWPGLVDVEAMPGEEAAPEGDAESAEG